MRCLGFWLAIALCAVAQGAAADTIRLAVQKTGTVAWELDVMRTHGLDAAASVTIETLELASPEAGKIALRGGSADIIVVDWLWVSRERDLGHGVVFYPYSSALGCVMTPPKSSIRTLSDLKGKTLAVAGGPIDKSWLLLRAVMQQQGIDPQAQARVVYGAPALLAGQFRQGAADALLNYWNFCARLEGEGFRRIVDIADLLPEFGLQGPLSMIGYAFDQAWAARNRDALDRFLAAVAKAKEILLTSDAEWQRIAPLTGAPDAAALKVYRDRYRQGIPRRTIEAEEADARVLYRVLARLGGSQLVGQGQELAAGTFYRPRGVE
ncbi:MAG: ABC transporter substrate-binding protein [Alphaproteobacteria bacterium]|nr:ABC transporter substrate-binding protein [Alphaproteobacteria bacterium]